MSPREILFESESSVVLGNLEPILPGHCIVAPKRAVSRLCELNEEEVHDLFETVADACRRCSDFSSGKLDYSGDEDSMDKAVDVADQADATTASRLSFNLSMKDGSLAGQCVPHLHVHVVPRRPGDLPSSDKVYSLLDTWTPDRVRVPPPQMPPLSEILPADDSLRVARTAQDMAVEADLYAAALQREMGRILRPGGDEDLRFSQWLKLKPSQVFFQSPSGLSLAFVNLKPLVPGHVLVIPKRIVDRYADLTAAERRDLWSTAREVQGVVCQHWCGGVTGKCRAAAAEPAGETCDRDPPGAHFGIQDGPHSGQSVPHVHVHVLPAHTKDTIAGALASQPWPSSRL